MSGDVAQMTQGQVEQLVNRFPLDCAIVIPTLNERDNVPIIFDALAEAMGATRYEIIFVDDWSIDGTAEAIASLAEDHDNVRLLRRYGRRGLSTAVVEGALASFAPIVVVMDADMQHDEAIVPLLLGALKNGADIAIGSRYCAEGSVGNWGGSRAKGSKIATNLAQLVLKAPTTDPMSGFFAMRRSVLLDALPHLSNMGFKILLDLLASAPQRLIITEVPYVFRSRATGESKLDSSVAIDFLLLIIDKKLGGIIPPRLIIFGAVGALGLVIQLSILAVGMLGTLGFDNANRIAVGSAIIFNFTLNNMLTYRDRRLRGWRWLRGLFGFSAVCGLGALANLNIGSYLSHHHDGWALAAVSGAIVGSLWNYVASSVLTWRKR